MQMQGRCKCLIVDAWSVSSLADAAMNFRCRCTLSGVRVVLRAAGPREGPREGPKLDAPGVADAEQCHNRSSAPSPDTEHGPPPPKAAAWRHQLRAMLTCGSLPCPFHLATSETTAPATGPLDCLLSRTLSHSRYVETACCNSNCCWLRIEGN